MDKFRWVELKNSDSNVFHDLRDEKNRTLGWVRICEAGILYWVAAEGENPVYCPCTTLEEAKRFVKAQYLLVK